MTFDSVFPIDPPDFLWVHTLTYRPTTGASVVVDAEGRWNYGDTTEVEFTGYITAPNPREVDRAATRGILLDAVCLAPHDVGITDSCHLTVAASSGAPEWMVGTYTVNTVRPNPSHLRILLTRIRDELPARDPGNMVSATITPDTVDGGV